jgi:CubicO group peptidase (beta-lactamase class C family)
MKTVSLYRAPFTMLLLVAIPVALLALSAGDFFLAREKSMAATLQPFVDRRSLAGAVTLVANKDKVLSLEAVGFADLAAQKPMQTDALFWIASLSKPITVAALMMLVDEGKVKLEDPVEKYLPEFKDQRLAAEQDKQRAVLKKPKHPITVRNILNHTSGMPFKSVIEEPTLDMFPLRVAVRSYAMMPLQFEPGSKYQYSNAGFNTAGRIIEVISRMPYEQFLKTRLFAPLDMKDTTFRPNAEQLKRLAKAYKPNLDETGLEETRITQLKYPLSDRDRQPMPAGGLFSTASDLGRFCRMILNGGVFEGKRYLAEAAVNEMTSRQTGHNIKEDYGLGWSRDRGTFGHGGAYGMSMTINAKRNLIMVFLTQHAGFPRDGGASRTAFNNAAEQQFGTLAPLAFSMR